MSKELLLIFTRNPELGKVKTRLAATVGDQAALDIYTFLLEHTVSVTQNLNLTKHVYYSEKIRENDLWDGQIYNKQLQQGNDLGERMNNAFVAGFKDGFEHIIIIGSDMYDIASEDIENAFKTLIDSDIVIGPAMDGGYYLLGMKTLKTGIFSQKDWGTSTVLSDTLKNLQDEKVALLAEKNDVDYYEDIEQIDAFKPFIKHIKTSNLR